MGLLVPHARRGQTVFCRKGAGRAQRRMLVGRGAGSLRQARHRAGRRRPDRPRGSAPALGRTKAAGAGEPLPSPAVPRRLRRQGAARSGAMLPSWPQSGRLILLDRRRLLRSPIGAGMWVALISAVSASRSIRSPLYPLPEPPNDSCFLPHWQTLAVGLISRRDPTYSHPQLGRLAPRSGHVGGGSSGRRTSGEKSRSGVHAGQSEGGGPSRLSGVAARILRHRPSR